MRQLSVPSQVARTVTKIESFKGVDLTNAASNVDISRSPEAPNMIRDVPGKVRKRMGYYLDTEYDDFIHGVFHLNGERIVHAGTKLYMGTTVLYSDMQDVGFNRSKAWEIGGRLYILDGKTYLVVGKFNGETSYTAKKVSEIATVPIVSIARTPNGEGQQYQEYNLIQPKFINMFIADGTTRIYQLSSDSIQSVDLVEQMNSDGDWVTVAASKYTTNLELGTVTFRTAPEAPTVKSRDNIRITASKVIAGYADMINKCTISIVYGVNGATDRLFVGGNPDYPNRDWFSGYKSTISYDSDDRPEMASFEDFTFFGDLSYSTIGLDTNEIVGYSLVGNYLATHKSVGEDGRNVIMRYGEYTTLNGVIRPSFRIVNVIQGVGAVGKDNFAYLNESLFATEQGIYAITAQDITGEKYTQNRSFYINGALAKEDLEHSCAVVYKDFYVLATPLRVYLLDGLQKVYEKNSPLSSFQYECYYWDIPNISYLFVEDETLCFGTYDGKIMKFYTDKTKQTAYNDNGKAIKARWDTNAIDGKIFYKKKNFRYLSAQIAPAINTSYEAWAEVKGIWKRLFNSGAKARYFDFSYVDFGKINFSSDATPRTIGTKIRIKKIDKVRFSFRNEELNEPFGLYAIGTEFTENGNYKG